MVGLIATIFLNLYPRVMVSSISPAFNLTIGNTSSAPYTLKVMTIVALIFTPLVLVYQGWSYWVFRARVRRPAIGAVLPGRRPAAADDPSGRPADGPPVPADPAAATDRRRRDPAERRPTPRPGDRSTPV